MSRRNRLLRRLEARWIACYGEPPPILSDPDLMRALMNADMAPENRAPRRDVALSEEGEAVAA